MQDTFRNPLTRREFLSYAQLLVGLLLLVAFAAVIIQFVTPRPEWVDLGSIDELQSDVPMARTITRGDGTGLFVWVVHADGKWFAFDAHVPFGSRCRYQWQPVVGRFEDPCSGARFARTGEYLDIYTHLRGTAVQNLDQYVVNIRDQHVSVDASWLIRAEPFIACAPTPECCLP